MNVTNPKVTLFFLALLPQFVDPTRGSVVLQMLRLGGVYIFATILIFGGIALLAAAGGNRLAGLPKFKAGSTSWRESCSCYWR